MVSILRLRSINLIILYALCVMRMVALDVFYKSPFCKVADGARFQLPDLFEHFQKPVIKSYPFEDFHKKNITKYENKIKRKS